MIEDWLNVRMFGKHRLRIADGTGAVFFFCFGIYEITL